MLKVDIFGFPGQYHTSRDMDLSLAIGDNSTHRARELLLRAPDAVSVDTHDDTVMTTEGGN